MLTRTYFQIWKYANMNFDNILWDWVKHNAIWFVAPSEYLFNAFDWYVISERLMNEYMQDLRYNDLLRTTTDYFAAWLIVDWSGLAPRCWPLVTQWIYARFTMICCGPTINNGSFQTWGFASWKSPHLTFKCRNQAKLS